MVLNLLWYFVFFSFCGWLSNGIRTLFYEKRFYNKGFLTSPFCPSYGLCAVVCYLIMNNFTSNKLILLFGSCVVLSLLVVIIGTVTEKLLGFKPWDFSNTKLSIGSYITLPYALFLGLLGFILVSVIIPVFNTVLVLIPHTVSLIIVTSVCALILLDYVFSIVTTVKLRHKIEKLGDVSELVGKDVPQEKIDEIESNYNKLFTENILRKRLASAFPDLKRTAYMKQISDKIEEIKNDNMKEYTLTFENEDE